MFTLKKSIAIVASSLTLLLGSPTVSFAQSQECAVIYVDITNGSLSAPDFGQNGWGSNAHRFLQDAITDAHILLGFPHFEDCVDIWVAQGTYRPDSTNANSPNGCQDPYACCEPYGNCNYTGWFETTAGPIAFYGGFPPDPHTWNNNEGAEFGDRDPAAYPTILDADLRGNDYFSAGFDANGDLVFSTIDPDTGIHTFVDNLDYLVSAYAETIIDGFTMRGAKISALWTHLSVTATVRNCIVMENLDSALSFGSSNRLEIRNSRLFHNGNPNGWGGAMQVAAESELVVIDSVISQNLASEGGGIWALRVQPVTLVNVVLRENEALLGGGAFIANAGMEGKHRFWNALVVGNKAKTSQFGGFGGGVLIQDATELEIINCTFADNDASDGGGIYVGSLNELDIHNSIFWGNTQSGAQIRLPVGFTATITHSCIEDCEDVDGCHDNGVPINNNIKDDPEFVDAQNGDYRLQATSPCIDAGDNCLLPCDEYDLEPEVTGWIDAGQTCLVDCTSIHPNGERHPIDLDTVPNRRVVFGVSGEIVDMGAFEWVPDCGDCPGDLSENGSVGVADLLALLSCWGPPNAAICVCADFTESGSVGVADLLELLANWGPCPDEDAAEVEWWVEYCIDCFPEDPDEITSCIEMYQQSQVVPTCP